MALKRIASILLLASSVTAAYSQDTALKARLDKAATVDALDTLDARPWHALIEAQIFDAKGKNPTRGTIEVWQSGSNRRVLYTFGPATMTEIVNGKASYRTNPDPQLPKFAPFLLAKVLHTGPTLYEAEHFQAQLQQRQVGSEQLDCISTKPLGSPSSFPGPAYCLDAQDHLRALFNFEQTVMLDPSETFLDHAVSHSLSITNSGNPTATGKITKLETYEPLSEQFTPTADMSLFVPTVRISGGVLSAHIVKKVQPTLPASSSAKGTVNLHVIIGPDGHLTKVELISAPDPAIGAACVDAVKQWIYKPYLINGDPVQVESTVFINIE